MRNVNFSKVDISMEKNHATIKTYAKDGKIDTKVTDLGSVMRVFKDTNEFDSGDLPIIGENAIGIRRVYHRGNRGVILVNGVNLIRDLKYGYHDDDDESRTFRKMHLPGLLLAVRFENKGGYYNILQSHMFAHKHNLLTEKDQLYIPPLGNIYGRNNCKICWGSAGLKRIDNLGQTLGMMEMFVSSHFNADLFRREWCASSKYNNDNLRNFLRDVHKDGEELGRYPYEHVRMARYGTYAELMSYLQTNL